MNKNIISIAMAAMLLAPLSVASAAVKADNLANAEESTVSYSVKTAEGEDVIVTVDYTTSGSDAEIENMEIEPAVHVADGTKSLKIPSVEGPAIEIQFTYSLGKRTGIKISSVPPDPSSAVQSNSRSTIESSGGYLIDFDFLWNGKELAEVRVEPRDNPFSV